MDIWGTLVKIGVINILRVTRTNQIAHKQILTFIGVHEISMIPWWLNMWLRMFITAGIQQSG